MVASLYFHFPFCNKKCPYCHFYVLKNDAEKKEVFLEAIFLELEHKAPLLQTHEIVSLYFGGGTPSLFPKGVRVLIEEVKKRLVIARDVEITVEANPEEVDQELLEDLKEMGVNRLSIGVQSLDDHLLKEIGREHSADQAEESVIFARKVGFENITIDLMYDLPHQTLEMFGETLKRMEKLPVTHLSLYNLVIEPNTPFYRKKSALEQVIAKDRESTEMLSLACDSLERMGLKRYEISAFAREGFESRHNCGYWTGRSFLGLGPSAFSFWEGRRFRNCANLPLYQKKLKEGKNAIDFEEKLSFPHNLHEQLAVELRLLKGVSREKYCDLPGETFKRLEILEAEGYLQIGADQMQLTEKGRLFYDTVGEQII